MSSLPEPSSLLTKKMTRSSLLALGTGWLLFALPASGATTDCATSWSNFNNPGFIVEYTFEGQVVGDEETSADTSHGPASVPPDWTDLASGSPDNNPGPYATSYFGYYNGGTVYDPDDPVTMEDDFILFRMRIQGDPDGGAAFDSKHWNVLFDIDGDGYKEYWVDLDGSVRSGNNRPDALKILYDDANRQDVPDPAAAEVERFTAFYDPDGDPSCPASSPGLSHTRVLPVGDGTGDYFIETQVPMIAFDDERGNQLLYPTSPVAFVFSTGASNQNPLQKDFMQDLDFLTLADPITFGDPVIPNGQPQIRFTTDGFSDTTFYTVGDDIVINVTDRNANSDPAVPECFEVAVSDPATGDEELVTVCETGPNTGIFTNLGGACAPEITNPSPVPDPRTAWILNLRTSSTTLAEDWTATYSSGTGLWTVSGTVSGVQTATVTAGVPYNSDGGEISFTLWESSEDPPTDGTVISFCTVAADRLTSSTTAGADDDGDLQVVSGDDITVSYTNANNFTVTDEAMMIGPCEAVLNFTRADGRISDNFQLTDDPSTSDELYVSLILFEANTNPAVAESVVVTSSGNDSQNLTLTETGPDTGIFRNSTGLQTQIDDGAVAANDGLWEDVDTGVVTATYSYTCLGNPYTVTSTAELFFVDGGGRVRFTNGSGTQDVEIYGAGEPVYLEVNDATACTTTVNLGGGASVETVTVTVTSDVGDSETVTLYETFPGTGLFYDRLGDLVTTSGSAVVTSASSLFVSDGLIAGDPFVIAGGPDAGLYTISSVDSETQVTLTSALTTSRVAVLFNSSPLLTATSDGTVVSGDGVLEADDQDSLNVSYSDCDDGDLDPSNDTKTDTALFNAPSLIINEVFFYPQAGTGCESEMVEILNTSPMAINATGYSVSDGDTFTFTVPQFNGSDIVLQPGESIQVLLWRNQAPADQFTNGTYLLFAELGTAFPTDEFADPGSADAADQVVLEDPISAVTDYVAWSSTFSPSLDFYGDDSGAVLQDLWQDDAFNNVTGISQGQSMVRSPEGFDSNTPTDWSLAGSDLCLTLTRAVVADFGTHRAGSTGVVTWATSSEEGTLGFDLYRWSGAENAWVALNEDLLPAVGAAGGRYFHADPALALEGSGQYLLVETESGRFGTREREHGPFAVTVDEPPVDGPSFDPGGPDFQAVVHEVPEKERRRLSAHGREKERAQAGRQNRVGTKVKIGLGAAELPGLVHLETAEIAGYFGLPEATIKAWLRGRRLELSHRGEIVAWEADADLSGLVFYAPRFESHTTTEDVFWLQKGSGLEMEVEKGRRPRAQPGGSSLDILHLEQDVFPVTAVAGDQDADFWYWRAILAGHPSIGRHRIDVDLDGLDSDGWQASLAARVLSATANGRANEHHVELRVNGAPIGEASWQGIAQREISASFDPALLADGPNVFEIVGLTTGVRSIFYVDEVELTWPRRFEAMGDELLFGAGGRQVVTVEGFSGPEIAVYEITDPERPRRIEALTITEVVGTFSATLATTAPDARYYAVGPEAAPRVATTWADQPSSWSRSDNTFDYLVIAPAELEEAAEGLAEYRRNRGLDAAVVLLEDVYDEFNHGLADPHAIADFLAHAYRTWQRPPTWAVLAGAGDLDYKNVQGRGGNLVPPLVVATPEGLYASDNRFGDVLSFDGVPEIAIGRLPVLTSAELDAYVAKIAAYENAPVAPWQNRAIFVADDNAGDDGDFVADSEAIAALAAPSLALERLYVTQLGAATVRTQLQGAISSGAGWINYVGHGGVDRLATEALLHTSNVPALGNGERLPIVTGLSCTINRYEIPGFSSLGEALVAEETGGAAAVWAPSGLSIDAEAQILGEEFARATGDRVGDRVRQALEGYRARGRESYIPWIYNYLGDPALEWRPASSSP